MSGRLDSAGRKWSADDFLRNRPGFERLESAGGMGELLVQSLRHGFTSIGWVREAVVEMAQIMRRCMVPLIVSGAVFTIGFGFFVLGGITVTLGATDREGGAVIIGLMREMVIWTTGMVFAGVAGSAITADLGSRKVRGELDALAVLGVERTKVLVTPKVMACILAAPVLALCCLLSIEIVNFALAPSEFGFSPGVLFASTKGSLITLDIYGALIRMFIIGAMVGVVACYKGLNSGGGTEGVGKAVNQTVVITFFGVWMLDAFFNLAYLSLFPEAQVDFKG